MSVTCQSKWQSWCSYVSHKSATGRPNASQMPNLMCITFIVLFLFDQFIWQLIVSPQDVLIFVHLFLKRCSNAWSLFQVCMVSDYFHCHALFLLIWEVHYCWFEYRNFDILRQKGQDLGAGGKLILTRVT